MSLPQKAFVLIRHGQTDANRDGVIAGRTEAMLTGTGRAAAAALSARPWPGRIRVFCSPQQRAKDTAALIFPGHILTAHPGLRERDWGLFEGRPLSEQPPRLSHPSGGEAWEEMLARVALALRDCLGAAGPALPVLVAHSGVIRAARALTGGDYGGASPPNTTPLLFTPRTSGGFEETVFDGKTPYELRHL